MVLRQDTFIKWDSPFCTSLSALVCGQRHYYFRWYMWTYIFLVYCFQSTAGFFWWSCDIQLGHLPAEWQRWPKGQDTSMRGVASTAHFNQCWATLSILKYTSIKYNSRSTDKIQTNASHDQSFGIVVWQNVRSKASLCVVNAANVP